MKILKRIAHELVEHAPFTAVGAVIGIIIMVINDLALEVSTESLH